MWRISRWWCRCIILCWCIIVMMYLVWDARWWSKMVIECKWKHRTLVKRKHTYLSDTSFLELIWRLVFITHAHVSQKKILTKFLSYIKRYWRTKRLLNKIETLQGKEILTLEPFSSFAESTFTINARNRENQIIWTFFASRQISSLKLPPCFFFVPSESFRV